MKDLWQTCRLKEAACRIGGELYRLVESQEQVATMKLADSLEAQSLLEEMLEATKPPVRSGCEGMHYLLHSPFRYPPLRHGSRFGTRQEPALFYGALKPATVLAEAAYYRAIFWHGMESPPSRPIRSQHNLFSARYATDRGLQLQYDPCHEHRAILADPKDYRATQALGSAMREGGIEAFEFPSARCPGGGTNVALFTPTAFAARRPRQMQQWLCETGAESVTFSHAHNRALYRFSIETFMVDGKLPWPAE